MAAIIRGLKERTKAALYQAEVLLNDIMARSTGLWVGYALTSILTAT
jgi:hypothetical protein